MIKRTDLALSLGHLGINTKVTTSMTTATATVKCGGSTGLYTKGLGKKVFKMELVSCCFLMGLESLDCL